jgi:hypothetical protein
VRGRLRPPHAAATPRPSSSATAPQRRSTRAGSRTRAAVPRPPSEEGPAAAKDGREPGSTRARVAVASAQHAARPDGPRPARSACVRPRRAAVTELIGSGSRLWTRPGPGPAGARRQAPTSTALRQARATAAARRARRERIPRGLRAPARATGSSRPASGARRRSGFGRPSAAERQAPAGSLVLPPRPHGASTSRRAASLRASSARRAPRRTWAGAGARTCTSAHRRRR